MDIKLEVLASSSIKRNKPWPKIQWIGQEHESLFMLDNEFHRISVLYVPSGKTKKKVPRLSTLVDSTICVGTTRDGAYLIGLTHHGDIFFWHKDRDILKTIRGLAGIVSSEELQQEPCRLFASVDCQYFLLVIGTQNVFVWKTEQSEDILESKLPEVQGSWNKVAIPNNIDIPASCVECAECSIDAVFFNHESLGNCCQMSVVYNKEQSLCIVSLLLRFGTAADFYSSKSAPFQVEWTVIQYPFKHIHPSYEPIQSRGAYVNCYANNGQVVAVAANQNTPGHSSMLFVSPLTDTVMVSEMKGCGVRDRYSKMG
ncbi:ciliogenesis and planar polarity effector 1-like, partial [Pecten maximus]|uniref:ciliogenesis and planar polarity effector 1-like n=1 Tax=Pecten maximus TaxID=6579 RepID=UPI001458CC10